MPVTPRDDAVYLNAGDTIERLSNGIVTLIFPALWRFLQIPTSIHPHP